MSKAACLRPAFFSADGLFLLALLTAGGMIQTVCDLWPSRMPAFMPWEFSWLAFLSTGLSLWWFFRGRQYLERDSRPARWRCVCFVLGVTLIYIVLNTHYLYLAEHMFFLNRIQHVVMHHIGPFFIALGAPGAAIMKGMPEKLAQKLRARPIRLFLNVVQQPFIAAFLFVGLVGFWLIPPIHFRAMLNPHLFWIMNWSMVIDGILFWWLVLDPRPKPPARASYAVRNLTAVGVMFPQIVIGAVISLSSHDIYPYYDFCGRIFPQISAVQDQMTGGIIVWIPPAMMSVIALLIGLNWVRLEEERKEKSNVETKTHIDALSHSWTGR